MAREPHVELIFDLVGRLCCGRPSSSLVTPDQWHESCDTPPCSPNLVFHSPMASPAAIDRALVLSDKIHAYYIFPEIATYELLSPSETCTQLMFEYVPFTWKITKNQTLEIYVYII